MADVIETREAMESAGLPRFNHEKTAPSGEKYYAEEVESGVTLSPSTGTLDEGSVVFADASGNLTEDNANFFYDNTNDRLHVGPRGTGTATGRFNVYHAANTPGLVLTTAGQLQLPVQGAAGGLLIGGELALYRETTNLLALPQRLRVGNLNVGATDVISAEGQFAVKASVAAGKVIRVQGATGQTGELQSWEDPTGLNPLAITAARNIIAAKGSPLVVGTSDTRELFLRSNGVDRWQVGTGGFLAPFTDQGADVGFTSRRIRTGYFGTSVLIHDGTNAIGGLFANGTGFNVGEAGDLMGFYGVAPVAQPTTAVAEATFVENAGPTNINNDSTFDGYTVQQVVRALRLEGVLA